MCRLLWTLCWCLSAIAGTACLLFGVAAERAAGNWIPWFCGLLVASIVSVVAARPVFGEGGED